MLNQESEGAGNTYKLKVIALTVGLNTISLLDNFCSQA
tara:strand:+ start:768 stop:881 length:114 start_codon:yes stop_codon:yes gene_type:complete